MNSSRLEEGPTRAEMTLRFVCVVLFALWFGGFTFYAGVVVPTGTDVLGSALAQGLITRRVAWWLVVLAGAMSCSILIDVRARWPYLAARTRGMLLVCGLLIGLASFIQWGLYGPLDRLIDATTPYIADRETFYRLHRWYLWAAVTQWLSGLLWASLWLSTLTPAR